MSGNFDQDHSDCPLFRDPPSTPPSSASSAVPTWTPIKVLHHLAKMDKSQAKMKKKSPWAGKNDMIFWGGTTE